MISRQVHVANRDGIHLRPAGQLCEKALTFKSSIYIKVEDRKYNAKSVLSVLSAQISMPETIELICDGPDEEEAMETMEKLLGGQLKGSNS